MKTKTMLLGLVAIGLILFIIYTFTDYDYITLDSVEVVSNEGIGDDWNFKVFIENQLIKKGEKYHFKDFIRVKVVAEEVDKYSDVGTGHAKFKVTEKGKQSISVKVRETNGRGAGKTALVRFNFTIR